VGRRRFFIFLILRTVGRIPWTEDKPVARPLPTHRTVQTQNKHTQIHVSSGIRTYDPSVWVGEDRSCLRARDHYDGQKNTHDSKTMAIVTSTQSSETLALKKRNCRNEISLKWGRIQSKDLVRYKVIRNRLNIFNLNNIILENTINWIRHVEKNGIWRRYRTANGYKITEPWVNYTNRATAACRRS
jgi:hypothetical protein